MLSIGTFSKISNVTTKALRYYDEIGLLKPVYINIENGYRYYNVEQLQTILLINKLKMYDFSLKEISEVLESPNDNSILYSIIKQKDYNIQSKLNYYKCILNQLQKDILNLERGISIMDYLNDVQVKLVETQPVNVISIRKTINIKDYRKHINQLYEMIKGKNLTAMGAPISTFHGEEFDPENYDVEIAVPVKEVVTGTKKFGGALCAMATLKGEYSKLTSVYSKINEWIEKENYEVVAPPYEIYITDPAEVAPEDNITEIYFPVKKQ